MSPVVIICPVKTFRMAVGRGSDWHLLACLAQRVLGETWKAHRYYVDLQGEHVVAQALDISCTLVP